jgi:hypothetical protein
MAKNWSDIGRRRLAPARGGFEEVVYRSPLEDFGGRRFVFKYSMSIYGDGFIPKRELVCLG